MTDINFVSFDVGCVYYSVEPVMKNDKIGYVKRRWLCVNHNDSTGYTGFREIINKGTEYFPKIVMGRTVSRITEVKKMYIKHNGIADYSPNGKMACVIYADYDGKGKWRSPKTVICALCKEK